MKIKLFVILFFFRMTPAASPQSVDSVLVLNEVIQEVMKHNPDLKSGQNVWKAADAAVAPAGALPDPVLGFNVLNLPVDNFVFDQEPMSGKQIVLTQKIPFPGKLKSERKIAEENSIFRHQQFLEQRNQLIKAVKIAYYNLTFVDAVIVIVQKNSDLLQQFVAIAQTRYQTGRGVQQNYLQAELELARNQEKLIGWKQKRKAFATKLNQLRNRPVTQPVPPTQTLEAFSFDFNLPDLIKVAEIKRPQTLAWEALMRQANERVSLVRKNFLPDLTLGVAWTQRDVLQNGAGGVDYLSGMLSVNLPLYFWKKQQPMLLASQQTAGSVVKQHENYLRELEAKLEIKLDELKQHQKLLELYTSQMIPRAQQNLESAKSAYQVSKVDFLTLINSQMLLFHYQQDYHRVQKDFFVSLAELEALVGGSLK